MSGARGVSDGVPGTAGGRDARPLPDSPAAGPVGTDAPVKAPPWEPAPEWSAHRLLHRLSLGTRAVADYVDGSGSPGFDSPRPHLHPVRTPGGVVVSDSGPRDHTWHVGLGIGVQDADGTNLWGGRTYVRGTGYTWRHDHGTQRHDGWGAPTPSRVVERLTWYDAHAAPLLAETRTLMWRPGASPDAWVLDLASELRLAPGRAGLVPLGSPGSNGRPGGGYGGFFWRLPACTEVDVRTPVGCGEDDVHGSVPAAGATWVAWSGRTLAEGSEVTVALAAPPDSAGDPWFVRVADYPGIGSSWAWEHPVVVGPDAPVRRGLRCLVADGRLTDDDVARELRD